VRGDVIELLGIASSAAVAATAAYSIGLCVLDEVNRKLHALAALTAAASAVFGVLASLQFVMGPNQANLAADRVEFVALLILGPAMVALTRELRRLPPLRWWYIAPGFSAGLGLLALTTPLLSMDKFDARTLALQGQIFDAAPGPLAPVALGYIFVCGAWSTYGFMDYALHERSPIAWVVYAGTALLSLTGINDAFAKLRVIDTGYVFAFGCLGCAASVATVSLFMHLEALKAARRGRAELEAEVEARTRALQDAQARMMQEHQLAAMGRLAGGVAHEINNPLAAIQANLSFLSEAIPREAMNPTVQSALSESVDACQRTSLVIKDLSSLSRKRRGGPTRLRLAVPVHAAVRFLSRNNPLARGVKAELDPEVWVQGDETGMGQVAINLIENALQAIEDRSDGEGRVLVKLEARDNVARLVVEDNGPGVPPEIRSRIFEPFFTTRNVGRGTGLGLSICTNIVADHGGAIELEEPAERGTRFVVKLPMAAAVPSA